MSVFSVFVDNDTDSVEIYRSNDPSIVDLKGVDKCVAAIDLVQKLNHLGKILQDEDANHDAAIKELTDKIDRLTEAGEDGSDA